MVTHEGKKSNDFATVNILTKFSSDSTNISNLKSSNAKSNENSKKVITATLDGRDSIQMQSSLLPPFAEAILYLSKDLRGCLITIQACSNIVVIMEYYFHIVFNCIDLEFQSLNLQ
jgi:hypothetical protein